MKEPSEEVKEVERRYEKALDDMEKHYKGVLEQIRDEIVEWRKEPAQYVPNYYAYKRFLELIDKYR